MRARDLFRLVLSNLARMRGRVVMTALGVLIGTMAIVVLIALASGLQASATGSLGDIGALNQITVFPSMGFEMGMGGRGGEDAPEAILTTNAMKEIEKMEGVVAVTPYESFFGSSTLKLNRMEGYSSLVGIDPYVVTDLGFEIVEGSDQMGRWTVIVGSRVAESFIDPLRPNYDPDREMPDLYGQTITVELTRFNSEGKQEKRTVRLRVGGVMKEIGGQDDTTIYMSIADMEELNTWAAGGKRIDRMRDGYTRATVITEDPSVVIPIEMELLDQGYFAFSPRSILQTINVLFTIIQAVLGGIGAIALVVAAIGIANTMIMSILERTREIGLMKAVGATNRDVLSVFIAEAGVIGLLGGISGIIAGIGVAKIIDLIAVAYINAETVAAGGTPEPMSITVIPLWLPLFAIGFSIMIGLGAGIYPALRAVQLDPVTALKYE